ncbi:hypothetical protein DDT91_19435 [Algoriphagus sp. AK58]|nr:hypothetical protein [Algoriphagus sp. AK58]
MLNSCKEDPAPIPQKTPEQIATEALAGSGTQAWTIAGGGNVTRDGRDVTDLYSTFELVLNAGSTKTYSSRNSNELFDASGNWSFAGSNFDKITLTGIKPAAGKEISFTQNSNTLRLQFNIPTPGSRINGQFAVAGNYTFVLLKK